MKYDVKEDAIKLCLANPEVDLWQLREFALTEGGLLKHSIRKQAWPKLVGIKLCDDIEPTLVEEEFYESDSPPHRDSDQVNRDIIRTSFHLLRDEEKKKMEENDLANDENYLNAILSERRKNLEKIINCVLRGGRDLHYFQGFHDIASIIYCVLCETSSSESNDHANNVKMATTILSKISHSHLKDFMKPDFSSLNAALNIALFPMIEYFDPSLHLFISKSGLDSMFALPWILTWFSHNVKNTEVAARLFDVFLSSHALFPFYMTVSIVLYHRDAIMAAKCELPNIFIVLSSIPERIETIDETNISVHVSWQDIINRSISFMRHIPPRGILQLAKNYQKGMLKPFLRFSSTISLLERPPSWILAPISTSKESPVLMNEDMRNQKIRLSNIKNIRNRFHVSSRKYKQIYQINDNPFLNDSRDVIIASGMGPDIPSRKKRRIIILGVVALLAISLGWYFSRETHNEQDMCYSEVLPATSDSCEDTSIGGDFIQTLTKII